MLRPGSIAEGRFDGPAPDVERALALVRRLIATGRPCVVIYADSSHGLLHGLGSVVPRRLFGAELGEFGGRRGYCVSWVELLRRMLNADVVAETKGTEKPAGTAKSGDVAA